MSSRRSREAVGRHIKDFKSTGDIVFLGQNGIISILCTSLKVCYIKNITERERSGRNTNYGAPMRGKRYDLSVFSEQMTEVLEENKSGEE